MTDSPNAENVYASPGATLEIGRPHELDITLPRILRIWWAFFWRNLVAIAGVFVVGGILGALLGFILGAAGVPPETIAVVTMPVGFILGTAFSVLPLWLILGKDFGEFRLVLLDKTPSSSRAGALS